MNNYLKVVELLRTKLKRAVVPTVGKSISVMFGTVSENSIKIIRRKMKNIKEDQKVLAQVVRESISILNITQSELAKNRATINWLVNKMETPQEEVGNVTDRLIELNSFVEQYFQLIAIINKFRQTSQSLITIRTCKNTIRYVVLGTFIFIY